MDPSVPDDDPVPYGIEEANLKLGTGGPWPGFNEVLRAWVLNHGGRENLSWEEMRAILDREPADRATAQIDEAQTAMILASIRTGHARPEGNGPQRYPVAHWQPPSTDSTSARPPRSSNNRPPPCRTPRASPPSSVSSRERWSLEDERRLIALEKRIQSWNEISSCFPGRTPAACRSRFIGIVGSGIRTHRLQITANQSPHARQTAGSGNPFASTMLRAPVAGSSELLALPTPARRLPHPTSTFHEADTADPNLRLSEILSPAEVRTPQRLPPIRDLLLSTLPAPSNQAAANTPQQRRFPGVTNPEFYTKPRGPPLPAARRDPRRPFPGLIIPTVASTTRRLSDNGTTRHQPYPTPSSSQNISAYGQRRPSGLTSPVHGDTSQRALAAPDRSQPSSASTALQTSNAPRRRHPPRVSTVYTMSQSEQDNLEEFDRLDQEDFERSRYGRSDEGGN